VLVFVALNVASLAWSSDVHAGLRYLTKFRYLLLIPVLATSIQPVFRRRAVNTFFLATCISVILSFTVLAGIFRFGGAHPGNPSPTMAHLDFSLVLALAALLILTRVLYGGMEARYRLVSLGAFLLVTAGLAVNIGRSGQLAFCGGLVFLLIHWARGRSPRAVVAVLAATIVILASAWWASPSFQARIESGRDQIRTTFSEDRYETSFGGRVAAIKVAGEIFRRHPLVGTGVGGNITAFRNLLDTEFPDLKPSIYWYRHFHNQYAQTASELGLVGLLALGWIFWELMRGHRAHREIAAAALVLGVVYLLGFVGEPYLRKQVPVVTFALFAGLISASQLDLRRSENEAGGLHESDSG
jgi:O-antigen ligase